jgi:hypothetical protein
MRLPAQNVLAIYNRGTKQLHRYIIPSFEDEIDDPLLWYDIHSGEAAIKIFIQTYKTFGKIQATHLDVQAYVNANT